MVLLCGHGTTSLGNSLKTPEELVRQLNSWPLALASSLAARPGSLCFDIFSLSSPCFLFSWIFPFCCIFPVSVWAPRCCSYWLFW